MSKGRVRGVRGSRGVLASLLVFVFMLTVSSRNTSSSSPRSTEAVVTAALSALLFGPASVGGGPANGEWRGGAEETGGASPNPQLVALQL